MNDNIIKTLEENFSLHDADQIYNLLSKFHVFDTKQGAILFNDWLKGGQNNGY